jgi:hypothetical protein
MIAGIAAVPMLRMLRRGTDTARGSERQNTLHYPAMFPVLLEHIQGFPLKNTKCSNDERLSFQILIVMTGRRQKMTPVRRLLFDLMLKKSSIVSLLPLSMHQKTLTCPTVCREERYAAESTYIYSTLRGFSWLWCERPFMCISTNRKMRSRSFMQTPGLL